MSSQTDQAEVTTLVAVDPQTAFEVFTQEVDAWWKHGKRFRTGERGASRMCFEAGVGGRQLEVFDSAADPFVLGRITLWQPAKQLVFEMLSGLGGVDLQPGENTEVDIRFESEAGGTRVTIAHRGWDAFAIDHPVRHGLVGEAFASMISLFWADLLGAHRVRSEEQR